MLMECLYLEMGLGLAKKFGLAQLRPADLKPSPHWMGLDMGREIQSPTDWA